MSNALNKEAVLSVHQLQCIQRTPIRNVTHPLQGCQIVVEQVMPYISTGMVLILKTVVAV
jgi:hypothetical protein